MAELQLHRLICPACHKPVSSFRAFRPSVACPRCGYAFKNPETTVSTAPQPGSLIPFSTGREAFLSSLTTTLVAQDYCAKDIFAAINTDQVFRAYVPMYRYEGQFQASWSCESSYEDRKIDVRSHGKGTTTTTKTVRRWRPMKGLALGRFSLLCLANEATDDLPDDLRLFASEFPYEDRLTCSFEPSSLAGDDENVITLERSADADTVWQKRGKALADKVAEAAAREQIDDSGMRKFRTQNTFTLTDNGTYVLVPFWFIAYKYRNEQYHFVMDGTGQKTHYTYPVDLDDRAFARKRKLIANVVLWLWLLLIPAYFLDWRLAAGLFGVWLIAQLVVRKVATRQVKAMLEASRQRRQYGADRL